MKLKTEHVADELTMWPFSQTLKYVKFMSVCTPTQPDVNVRFCHTYRTLQSNVDTCLCFASCGASLQGDSVTNAALVETAAGAAASNAAAAFSMEVYVCVCVCVCVCGNARTAQLEGR